MVINQILDNPKNANRQIDGMIDMNFFREASLLETDDIWTDFIHFPIFASLTEIVFNDNEHLRSLTENMFNAINLF